jgi:hypothetical protein
MPLRRKKPTKGTIIADENANRIFVNIAREEGWKIITITPMYRGIKLSDPQLAIKYAKQIHPIFTADTTACKLTKQLRGKSGYIIHKNPSKKLLDDYKQQVRIFFKTYTEKHTHSVIWTINKTGKPTKKKILQENKQN